MQDTIINLLIGVASVCLGVWVICLICFRKRQPEPKIAVDAPAVGIEPAAPEAVVTSILTFDEMCRMEAEKLFANRATGNAIIVERVQDYLDNNLQLGAYLVNLVTTLCPAFTGQDVCKLGPFVWDNAPLNGLSVEEGKAVITCGSGLSKDCLSSFTIIVSNTFPHLRMGGFNEYTIESLTETVRASKLVQVSSWYHTENKQDLAIAECAAIKSLTDDIDGTVQIATDRIGRYIAPPVDTRAGSLTQSVVGIWFELDERQQYLFDSYYIGNIIAKNAITFEALKTANHNNLFHIERYIDSSVIAYKIYVRHEDERLLLIDTTRKERLEFPPAVAVLGLPLTLQYSVELGRLLETAIANLRSHRENTDPTKLLDDILKGYLNH